MQGFIISAFNWKNNLIFALLKNRSNMKAKSLFMCMMLAMLTACSNNGGSEVWRWQALRQQSPAKSTMKRIFRISFILVVSFHQWLKRLGPFFGKRKKSLFSIIDFYLYVRTRSTNVTRERENIVNIIIPISRISSIFARYKTTISFPNKSYIYISEG